MTRDRASTFTRGGVRAPPFAFMRGGVRARSSALLSLLLVVAFAGCGMGGRTAADPFGTVPSAGQAGRAGPRTALLEVSVQNRTGATIHVTARDDRRTQALGDVETMDSRAFQVRWTRRADLTFLVRADGAEACVTRAIEAEPGRSVVLTVDPARTDAPGASTANLACDAVVMS